MQLLELTQADFIDRLASGEPTPGGGSAAALEGALGAALVKMVAGLTAGRDKYASAQPLVQKLLPEITRVQQRLAALVEDDSAAYAVVTAVFSMPKNTPEEKNARKAALQKALKGCTQTPLDTMEAALEGLRLAARLADSPYNHNAASDLGAGALSLKAALHAAWLNVLINLDGLEDEAFAQNARRQGQAALKEGTELADDVYQIILRTVQR